MTYKHHINITIDIDIIVTVIIENICVVHGVRWPYGPFCTAVAQKYVRKVNFIVNICVSGPVR